MNNQEHESRDAIEGRDNTIHDLTDRLNEAEETVQEYKRKEEDLKRALNNQGKSE